MTVDMYVLESFKAICGIRLPFVVQVYPSVLVAPAVINSSNLSGMLTFSLLRC